MEIVLVFTWLVCAIVAGVVASHRGRSGFGWFLLGCLIGIFAIILVALLPPLQVPVIVAGEAVPPMAQVRCPDCKELVLSEARVCKHCHRKLIPASEQAAAQG